LRNQNREIRFYKVKYKKEMLISIIVLAVLCPTFMVEATLDSGKQYSLSLTAREHYSTITLTACLTFSQGKHSTPVSGASIQFFLSTNKGVKFGEIGSSLTDRNGLATFSYSATSNGNYWFIAVYTVNQKESGITVT
jgi:hypothetical protein